MSLEPCISPGVTLFTLHVPIESDLQSIESLKKRSIWYTKVEQMYELIAYELRYKQLSLIEHGSICMKAQFV